MTTPLMRILDLAKDMDAHDARQARDIFDARLRELECSGCLSIHVIDLDALRRQREGAELQAGLEEAVVRERERLDEEAPA